MNSNQRKIGILLSYCNMVIGMIIPFFYTPIMLNMLGQAEYGLYGLSSSITSYLYLLNLGMGVTVNRYVIKYRSEDKTNELCNVVGLFSVIYMCISVVIIFLGVLIALNNHYFFSKGLTVLEIEKLKYLIIIMSFNMPISMMGSIYSSIILAYEKFSFKYFIDITGTICLPILNILMLYLGYASLGMACASLLLGLFVLPINIYYCLKKLHIKAQFKSMPLELIKEIFSFSFVVLISSLADLLFWSTDKVLIGSLLGSVQVAIYNVGNTFTTIFQNMSLVISNVFNPTANKLVFTKQPIEESTKLLIKVGRIQFLIISLVLSGFIVFGKEFLCFWAGTEYEVSYYVALYTMIPLAIPLIQTTAFSTLMALNKHLFRSIMYFAIAIINVVSTYLVIPTYGVVGASLCTAFSFVIGQGIILNTYYYRVIKLNIFEFWKNIVKMSMVPFVMVCIHMLLKSFFIIGSFKQLIISIVIYTSVYCFLSWLFTLNQYEKELLKSLTKHIIK